MPTPAKRWRSPTERSDPRWSARAPRSLRSLALGLVPALALLLPTGVAGQDPDRPAQDSTREEKNPAQEGLPLAPDRTLEFTTTEGSWMSVDVSPDGRTLVFDLLGDIYTMPMTGGRATPLTQGMAMDAQPRFSPDGTKVVFTSDRSGGEGVWVMSLDKSDTTQITTGKSTKYDSPEWTPDGKYVVVTRGLSPHVYHVEGGSGIALIRAEEEAGGGRGGGGSQRFMGAAFGGDDRYVWMAQRSGSWQYNTPLPDYQLVVYDRQTGETTRRTSRWGSAFRPTLSPDGRWLVYGSRHEAQTGLRIRDLNTGEERWLAYPVQRDDQESRATLDAYPGMSFTPDSRNLIAFYGGKLWSIPVDGGAPRNIAFEVPVKQHLGPAVQFDYEVDDSPTFTVKQIRDAVPSPDGSRLALVALDRVYVMGYPEGQPRRLTNSEAVEFKPAWSPDGQWLAFTSWSDTEGGHVVKVRSNGQGDAVRVSNVSALYEDPVWSPDGTRIIVSRAPQSSYLEDEVRGVSEYVWFPADGGDATFITAASGLSNLHFAEIAPDRIIASSRGTLISMRWDGTDRRDIVEVDDGSLVLMAPVGDQALAQVNSDIYVVTVPVVGGTAPTVSVGSNSNFPSRKLTDIGGQFPAWSADGRKVHWSMGNAHVVYDLDRAKAFDDSVRAAREARERDEDEEADSAEAGGRRGGSRDTPRFEPDERRITITAQRDIPSGTAVLRGGRAITMRGDEVIENADIVVRDGRIVAVGARGSVEVPSGARIIDISGTTVTPGFVDTHAHLRARGVHRQENWSYAANLAHGVTLTRDPQTGTTDVLSYSDMVEAGKVLGPRIYSTGPGVFSSEDIEDLDHARRVLKRYSEYYDTKTIKQYVAGNREQRQWIIQAANELELMPTTEGSLDVEMTITEAIDGYSGHEHSITTFPLYSDFIRLLAESKMVYTPTILVAYGGPWAENFWYATEDVVGDEKLARFTPLPELDSKIRRRDDGWFHPTEHVFPLIGETVADLIEAGGRAGVGSHGQLQGLGYHWELWSVASGGLSNHDALRVATLMGADAIGLDNDLGSLEGGKLADLVVLNSNPLDDLRATNDIRYVMKNGRLYDADTLDEIWPTPRKAKFYWQVADPSPPAGMRPNANGSGSGSR